MKTGRTLQPEDRISHYRIVGPLGAGGMGEVYLAQDSNLDRSVAVKILPHEVIRNEERVRRFVLEAKSASSLNHPNIVTIYEIGQDVVRTRDDRIAEPDSGPVHYISMELITGETLTNKIHEEKTDLRTLLGYLSQAAEGIAKAHAAGIVHRDLKPGNIMISKDGYAKVLDFGLAKLTEKREGGPDFQNAPTIEPRVTNAGMVIGTVGYMAPEQVQGRAVDQRCDIFSFGCILYEAATRQRPFVAESDVETMHKIIHEKPIPVENLNAEVPGELRRIIRRCLAKSPEQRFQSMKDLAIELREIADDYDNLSLSATSGATLASGSVLLPAKKRGLPMPLLLGGAVVLLAVVALGIWALGRGRGGGSRGFQTMRISSQTNVGDVTATTLSRDGRFLAYLTQDGERFELRVRQVATGSDREVLPAEATLLEAPSFSPDGNYLFYLKRKPDAPLYRTLFRIPSLGGPPEEITFDVDTRADFAPDGKQFVFMRGIPQDRMSAIVIFDMNSRTERQLVTVRAPEQVTGPPSWSPDGKRIAAAVYAAQPKPLGAIALLDVASGRRQDIRLRDGMVAWDTAWLPDGRALVVNAQDWASGGRNQIYLVKLPGGDLTPITNDMNVYATVSLSHGEEAIATVRAIQLANLWVAGGSSPSARQITSFTNPENSPWQFALADGDRVLFVAPAEEGPRLWSLPVSGGEQKQIPTGSDMVVNPRAGAGVIAFVRIGPDLMSHIWRANADGSGARQLTNGSGERMFDVSRDGRYATYTVPDSARGVWLLPLEGGDPVLLSSTAVPRTALFSPDGKHVLIVALRTEGGLIQDEWQIIPVTGGDPVATISLPRRSQSVQWGPNGESLTYIDLSDSNANIYRQRIAGGPPEPVTRFREGRIESYGWSSDGTRLAVVRTIGADDNVWITTADGRNPTQVTSFTNLEVFTGPGFSPALRWMPDDQRVVLRAGTESSDAVLIRDFR